MRILHLDSGREMRGGQWQALRLHEGLLGRGHESLLLAREGSPMMTSAAARSLPCRVLRPLRLPLLSRGFDIVHAHDARSHTLGAMLARRPLVVSRRVAFPVRNSALSRWKYRQPVLFLAVSRYVGRELAQAGVDEKRIVVVYDGVPVPAEPARGNSILIPYSLDPAKGMALAEAAVQTAGLSAKVSTDLEADLPYARALIYLSRSEGLGSGILLGMAHGVTVIASNTGGIPELIQDGVNGVLTENEPGSIVAALQHIDSRLGLKAREAVLEAFSVQHMIGATVEAYQRACSC